MRKFIRLISAILVLMTVFFCVSCNGDSDTTEDALTLSVTYPSGTNQEQSMCVKLKNAFEQKMQNEGLNVSVKLKSVTMGSGYNTTLLQGWQSGTLSDILFTQNDIAARYANNGVYLDLQPYFDAVVEAGEFNFDLYDEAAFTDSKLKDGHIYYAPRTIDQPVIFLNKDLFTKYGVEVPTFEGWTWTKLVEVMADLRAGINNVESTSDAKTIMPLDLTYTWSAFYDAFIKSFGGYVYNPETGDVGFTESGTKAALTKIKELIDNKYIPTNGGKLFVNKKAAMYVMSRASVATLEANGTTNVEFLPLPIYDSAFTRIENGSSYYSYGTTGWAINSKSEKKELAWKFLQFTLSEEGQEIMSSNGTILPIIKSMQTAEDATWKTCFEFMENVNQDAFIFDAEKQSLYTRIAAAYARTVDATDVSFESSIYTQVESSLKGLSGATSIETFASNAQTDLEKTVGTN